MKKTLLSFSVLFFTFAVQAQEYTPLQVSSGYNADVIADGLNPAAASTSSAVDNANFNFLSNDYQATESSPTNDFGLPTSGYFESGATSGLTYQMAPFYENNSLQLHEQGDEGTLTFANAVTATDLYFMVSSGSGQATFSGLIYFSDNSTQEIVDSVVPDWFYSNLLPVITSGFGRVNRENDIVENPFGNPRLYQLTIAILPENQAKTVSSVYVYKTSIAEGVINIMGVSAKILPSCPSPSGLEAASTANGGTISWTSAVITPGVGYDYYYSTDSTTPSESQTPTGTLPASATTVTLSSLATGQQYYFWIRSNCSASSKGEWTLVTFTTGQLPFPYNEGDISTLYSSSTVTVDSENSCPGFLTVSVPVGYQIVSTATSYQMQTASNGWMSEQRSLLICNTSGVAESEITAGVGGSTGTYSYSREGLDIANGLTGDVQFELRAWRTYGSSDCNMDYNRVLGDTWTVTITYQTLGIADNQKNSFVAYPNPTHDILNVSAEENISSIKIYNMLGQEILNSNGGNNLVQLNISSFAKGTYLLKAATDNGVKTINIIKD
ncbi:MAG: T9SS type A sorting domain-containing protein [Flavobacterium sp.]|nr:T9SS type A sorting domain-containing protein [Flavobacterium sp.]